jgi:adenylate cyclase
MNIIFGDTVKQVAETHTVLELDTFKLMPSEQVVTSYCVIDNLPLAEFPQLEANKNIHQQLIAQYRQQNWEFCRSALHSLTGCWNGEMDTFYQHLAERIDDYSANPPGSAWDGVVTKEVLS